MSEYELPGLIRVGEIIGRWQGKIIAVLGDIMLDHYLWGDVERISPEAPVPIVEVREESHLLGGAANVALNLKKLGCSPLVFGLTGDDAPGKKLIKLLSLLGIDSFGIETLQYRQTTVKTRIIANNQQVVRADREDRREIDEDVQERLLAKISGKIGEIAAIIISDYGKGVITRNLLNMVIELCRKKGVFVAVDPKDVHFRSYRKASVITPNHHEAGFAYGMRIRDEKSLFEVGRGLLSQLELESILITRGKDGMALLLKDGSAHLLPTVALKVFDVTGAGDTVISSYTAAVCGGASPLEAAFIANQAAGVVVATVGTAQVSAEELKDVIGSYFRRLQ